MDRDGLSLLFVVFDHDKDQNKKKNSKAMDDDHSCRSFLIKYLKSKHTEIYHTRPSTITSKIKERFTNSTKYVCHQNH